MKAEIKKQIVTLYPEKYKQLITLTKGDTRRANALFFRFVRENVEATLTDAQIRGVLVSAKIYNAHNPRTERKKKGKNKKDWVTELENLVGAELPSAHKLTIEDLARIIERINKQ